MGVKEKFLDYLKTSKIKFIISNGEIHVNDSLSLNHSLIKELPDNLTVIGILSLDGSQVECLPKNLTVKASLDLRNSLIKSIPADLKCEGNLFLQNSLITELQIGRAHV